MLTLVNTDNITDTQICELLGYGVEDVSISNTSCNHICGWAQMDNNTNDAFVINFDSAGRTSVSWGNGWITDSTA